MSGFSAILWRSALLGASLLIAWQVVRFGLAAHYAKQVEAGDGDAVEQVLYWRSNHPFALYAKGLAMAGDDPRSASELFERAYMANPTDSRPLLALAEVHLEAGRVDEADALMRMVDRLTPVHPFIQRRLARYWGERDETPTALRHLSKAMAGDDNIALEGFPLMLQLAEDPVQRGLLEPFALERPRWWPEFFRHASYRAQSTDSLRYLIALRSRPDAPELTRKERVHYQDRLLRDGFAAEAYLTWLNTLDPDERRQVGLIFDGGFELPFGRTGFSWRTRDHKQLTIRRLRTFGTEGSQSLMVRFGHFDERFSHMAQLLYLQAGAYRLEGSVRLDDLKTQGGVTWQLHCFNGAGGVLGESEAFSGNASWRAFSFGFEVPSRDCDAQELRLVSAGEHGFELAIDGVVWFDGLSIRRVEQAAAPPPDGRSDES